MLFRSLPFKKTEKIKKENGSVMFKNLTGGAQRSEALYPNRYARQKKVKKKDRGEVGVAGTAKSPAAAPGGYGDGEGRERG